MFYRVVFIFLLLAGTIGELFAADTIVLNIDTNRSKLELQKNQARELIGAKSREVRLVVEKLGDEYFLKTTAIKDEKRLISTLFRLKKSFPSAFVVSSENGKIVHDAKAPVAHFAQKKVLPPPANSSSVSQSEDNGWLWWLIGLAVAILFVLLIGLYISSLQVGRMLGQHEQMKKKQEEMEKRQHELFSDLGESIYNMSKDVIHCTQNMISEIDDEPTNKRLESVMKKESKLLDATEKLLRFLKLKAHKVEIKEETFNINNMLDDIIGSLSNRFEGNSVELVFELDRDLPKFLVGDLTQMGEIIGNLLTHNIEYMIEGEVVLEISSYETYHRRIDLQIKISQHGCIQKDDIPAEDFFTPYFDEASGEYKRLGLFVAHDLIELMGGSIALQNISEQTRIIGASIPLKEPENTENTRRYPLPEKSMTEKEVYIVNESLHSSRAIKNLFAYFHHNVTVDTSENFLENRPELENYDIVLIEESLIDSDYIQYMKILKRRKNIKFVGLGNIFAGKSKIEEAEIFDRRLFKPLTQERIYFLLIDLFKKEELEGDEDAQAQRASSATQKRFLRNVEITPGIRVESFADFSGSRVLIVEDNEINLKMMLKLLENSGMVIDYAENGLTALEKIMQKGPKSFDIVLMDINMPIMDGYRATEEILEIPGTQRLPIVALTALSTQSEIERMGSCGMRAYLPKPLNLGKLYTVFTLFLQKQPSAKSKKSSKKRKKPVYIDGIDLQAGLKHVDGNIIFYVEILEEFLEIYGDSGERAREYLASHRLEELRQLNLDVLGIAGTIGARDLYHAASMIHRVFSYNKLPLLPHYVWQYEKEAQRVRKSVKRYLNSLK